MANIDGADSCQGIKIYRRTTLRWRDSSLTVSFIKHGNEIMRKSVFCSAPSFLQSTVFVAAVLIFAGCGGEDSGQTPLEFSTAPPTEQPAGESFDVQTALVDDAGESVGEAGLDVEITLNKHEFADGETTVVAESDDGGVADFELAIEKADEDYELAASIADDSAEVTETFSVVATEADEDMAEIYGEDGVADGETEAEITIELFDEYDNPLIGEAPEFTASGEGNEYGDCSEVDASGIANCSMTSGEAEEKTLEITDPVAVEGDTIQFLPGDCDEDGTPFGGGDGTEDEPHLLCSPSHLQAIGDDPDQLGDHWMLVTDIDMAVVGLVSSIGDAEQPFSGTFDGAGNAIQNLTIEAVNDDNVGFFGVLGETAMVESVTLEDVNIRGHSETAGLAGRNYGSIDDSHTTGVVIGEDSRAGGLVGSNEGDITDSSSSCGLENSDSQVGGLVGFNDGEIYGSEAAGDIDAPQVVGGLVGANLGVIDDSKSSSDINAEDGLVVGGLVGINNGLTTDSSSSGAVTVTLSGEVGGVGQDIGGLVGTNEGEINFSNSSSDVHGGQMQTGGLAGANMDDGLISASYATGDVHGEIFQTGGLLGRNIGETVDSYSTGSVFGGEEMTGGFVGGNSGDITNCYAAGSIEYEENLVGGFVGHDSSTDAIISSYWDEDTTGLGTSDGGVPLTTDEFADESNFDDWDFGETWEIDTAPDDTKRPVLQWQDE